MQREAKKAKTRDAIVHAAYSLFVERGGVTDVTIDEIAKKAGVARRTFFRYFATKEAVVFPLHAERVETFRTFLAEEHEGETGFGAIRRASLAMAEVFTTVRKELMIQHQIVSASPELVGLELMLDRHFQEAMVEAIIKRDGKSVAARRRAHFLASATMGVVRATFRNWLERGAKPGLVKIGEEAFAFLEEGFGPIRRDP